ncbi:hypothetical protein GCM10010123_30520 [Pilimelia anulata]|uniref:Uncharacterized protein n=1 Tax=Pilimelia anulata TaxID=53371 RepID=A0A8J3B9A3_9ACTN|nr:hypothetical protein [Pilimelia anulata]GGJ98427.1 hypothetical protein GCM10010123_30520 [Pilimelia anulata]
MRESRIGRKAGRAALIAAAVLALSVVGITVASAQTDDRGGNSTNNNHQRGNDSDRGPVHNSPNPFRDIEWM